MQNILSYGKPIDFKNFWEVLIKDCYPLRNSRNFHIPLVKSVRVSHLPQFKFPEIFNHFPEEFKWIMERKDFIKRLEEFYHLRYKKENCNKRLCKFCSYDAWMEKSLTYIQEPKTLNYTRYVNSN